MKSAGICKRITCLACLFSLIFAGGFSSIQAETKGRTFPIGEMISRGQVMIQAQENVWKKVEPASMPVFQGMTVKTEKGTVAISLAKGNQIEVGPDSILVFERNDQIRLLKGSLEFRIAPAKALTLRAGNLIIVGSLGLQAGTASASLSGEEALGSLMVHTRGAVTVQGNRGQLTVLNQERAVLATVSSKNSVTIPASIATGSGKGEKPPVQMAQVGEEEEPAVAKDKKEPASPAKPPKAEGLSGTTWLAIGAGVLALGGIGALAAGGGGGGGGDSSPPPACP